MTHRRSPSEFLPERIESVRRRREWTQQQLADAMNTWGNGAKIDRSTIAKVESGKRAVTVDEVFWFAAALGVSPLALLLPRGNELVRVTPGAGPTGSLTGAVRWFRGFAPLAGSEDDGHDDVRFFEEQRPDFEVTAARRLPGVLRLVDDAALVVALLGDDKPGEKPAGGVTPDQAAVWFLGRVADDARALRRRLTDRAKERDLRRVAGSLPTPRGRKQA